MSVKARDWAFEQAGDLPLLPAFVLVALGEFCYGDSLTAEVGVRRLAAKIGRDDRKVRDALHRLQEAGKIDIEIGGGKHSQRARYHLKTADSQSSVSGSRTADSAAKTADSQSSEPRTPSPHVPGVPAIAGTTPTTPPSAAVGAARSARSAPREGKRGKWIKSAEREYICAECHTPGDSGRPARWWREDGEVVTAHAECPSEEEQREYWIDHYRLPYPDEDDAIAELAGRIANASTGHLIDLGWKFRRAYGKGNTPTPLREAYKARREALGHEQS